MSGNSLLDRLSEESMKTSGMVTCLGQTFANDADRRKHFTEVLRLKLLDPEFRKIEGFPHGSDEDILNLSDPPYYTACPNPWLADFIAEWDAQKPVQSEDYHYHREPFAADVSEGKTDQFYRAHTYHTKVPHKAIMRYLLHYTLPGDIVFDGFCGSGMTGIAAQMCGDRNIVMSLGYQVKPDGTILQKETLENEKTEWKAFSKTGVRYTILNDLAPAATFIAAKYNLPFEIQIYEKTFKALLKELHNEIGWMYETWGTDGKTKGKINYTVWSEVFSCPECSGEIVFYDEAYDSESYKVFDYFPCPHCATSCTKNNLELSFNSIYDQSLGDVIEVPKRVPVLINYSIGKTVYEKKPDASDIQTLQKIDALKKPDTLPTDALPDMQMANVGRMKTTKTNYIHNFFLPRQAQSMGLLWKNILNIENKNLRYALLWTIEQSIPGMSILNRYQPIMHGRPGGSQVNRQMAGVFYVPSHISECSPWYNLEGKIKRISKAFGSIKFANSAVCIYTGDCSKSGIRSNSIDYIFTDPPFGENIYYSDLNFLVEAWHRVKTNPVNEAIVDKVKNKKLPEYQALIEACFREYYRTLKPGRWITIEFSNTKASVWNSIQLAIANSGFIVASVSALDKKQGTFQAVNTPTAVKQDLVISAYKPSEGFEKRFSQEAQTEEGVWDFVHTHLKYLPVTKRQGILLQMVPERDPRILFDQMVAYFVRKGYPVPISSQEFQMGLSQRFIERDGMYFLPDQAPEYDRKKMTSGELQQTSYFVFDEASMIQWLRQLVKEKPQTFAEINPQFMQQLGGWSKNEEQLDLRELLNQNFLCYDGKELVPEQIHAYLSTNWKELRNLPKDDTTLIAKACDRWYLPDPNKAGDLEKLREKALLKEFEEYKQANKKLKVFRLEAVRAGFKKSWQERDYTTIVAVADKIPNNVLEEDPKLLMWYDQAVTRIGGD
ncbi:MAG: DNA methyltransferase [Methylococcales bacterium]|nr:DNA methyltransferase [Methylococcales bacterium]